MNTKPKSRIRRWMMVLVVLAIVAVGGYFAVTRLGLLSQTPKPLPVHVLPICPPYKSSRWMYCRPMSAPLVTWS